MAPPPKFETLSFTDEPKESGYVTQWTLRQRWPIDKAQPLTYHVSIWRAPWQRLLWAYLFHWTVCRLFGGWRGWTRLGDLRLAPDKDLTKKGETESLQWRVGDDSCEPFTVTMEHGRWHRKRRMPLYALADLHCPLDTGFIYKNEAVIDIEFTKEQYETLLGGRAEEPGTAGDPTAREGAADA